MEKIKRYKAGDLSMLFERVCKSSDVEKLEAENDRLRKERDEARRGWLVQLCTDNQLPMEEIQAKIKHEAKQRDWDCYDKE